MDGEKGGRKENTHRCITRNIVEKVQYFLSVISDSEMVVVTVSGTNIRPLKKSVHFFALITWK